MKVIRAKQSIQIPQGIKVEVKSRVVTVTGKHGTLKKDFRHLPVSIAKVDLGRKLEVSLYFGLSKQVASLRTVCSHVDNMITGVTKKYRYNMRLVYAHFPIGCSILDGGKRVEIKNFLGEKIVRTINMCGDTKCVKDDSTKDAIYLEGPNIDDTSRSAALIHQSCLVKRKDIRKFLDGVYVSSSGPIEG
jgi:large subunit ribosomal protein L9e